MSALSSKLRDVLNLGAGLDFGLALATNMTGSTYSSASLRVVCITCVMYLSCFPTLSVMERISIRITSKVTLNGS